MKSHVIIPGRWNIMTCLWWSIHWCYEQESWQYCSYRKDDASMSQHPLTILYLESGPQWRLFLHWPGSKDFWHKTSQTVDSVHSVNCGLSKRSKNIFTSFIKYQISSESTVSDKKPHTSSLWNSGLTLSHSGHFFEYSFSRKIKRFFKNYFKNKVWEPTCISIIYDYVFF